MIITLAAQVPGFTPGPGWNLIADLQDMLSFAFMRNAFAAGTASAIVAGLIGYFVVLRQSSFAAHAISHIGFAGAAGAVLLGFSPVLGVAVLSLAASEAVQVSGVLLIFALLVAPGAIAERVARRPAAALAISGGLAVLITWISLVLSYYTPYPVSFYVTSLAFVGYLAARGWTAWARQARRAGRARRPAPPWRGHSDAEARAPETATVRT
jgi:ABC-type Mn2+/Zn2+ transport system permease subunit